MGSPNIKETALFIWFGRKMNEANERKLAGEAGFTLIELLVVIT